MAEEWATAARRNSDWQRSEEQAAITIIQHLLERKIDPQAAAANLASTYEASLRNGDTDLWFLWTAFFNAIDHLGNNINNLERLVQMIRCVSKLPDLTDEHGRAITTESNARIFWRDVPDFAFYFREAALDVYGVYINQATWDNHIRKHRNSNRFAALYLHELDPLGPRGDLEAMQEYAKWSLVDALELPLDTPERFQQTEIYVPPAAQWILIAGRNIHRCCRTRQDNTGDLVIQCWKGAYGGTLLWTGEEGFSIERWEFWKQRFGEIAQLGENHMVKQLAAQAAEEMGIIDSEHALLSAWVGKQYPADPISDVIDVHIDCGIDPWSKQ